MNFPNKIKIYFDGSITKNPGGVAGFGWVIVDKDETELARNSGVVCEGAEATNNIAEWGAVRDALRFLSQSGWQGDLEIIGDSQLVIRQLDGSYKCRKASLIPFHKECIAKLGEYNWSAKWVPREENTLADSLSRVD